MNTNYQNNSTVDSCLVNRRKRCKSDWAGTGVGDAFNQNIDYFQRTAAQRIFYKACRNAQLEAARAAGREIGPGYMPATKPQLGPCYTSYPSTIASYAAIGLTGYLEFDALVGGRGVVRYLDDHFNLNDRIKNGSARRRAYRDLAQMVAKSVQTRLILEDLSRKEGLPHVDIHRLFSASRQSLRFESLPEILNAGIIFGDVLPDRRTLRLHPVTLRIFEDIEAVSGDYYAALSDTESHQLAAFGAMWVADLCDKLFVNLPESKEKTKEEGRKSQENESGTQNSDVAQESLKTAGEMPENAKIAPLNGPNPPMLTSPPTAAERALSELKRSLENNDEGEQVNEEGDSSCKKVEEVMNNFSSTIDEASGQHSQWEDIRSDLVERIMQQAGFESSPVEGNPADGHEVSMNINGHETSAGEIFDRPVELSDDIKACEELKNASRPIADRLKRTLYPNIEERVQTDRLRSQGSLDPARLAMVDFSSAIFKRYHITGKEDRNGKPLLLIACDASGSLDSDQMKMVKTLSSAWLLSTSGSAIQVMAGLYHSGSIRKGVTGSLVQWIFHPQKTPAVSRIDAVRAIASLPESGTGRQSDAISLKFMMDEAVRVARGRKIYLILISDCRWNRSFEHGLSAEKEVRAFFENAEHDTSGNLHTTLVALGVDGETGFEDLIDKVIVIPPDELLDVYGLAEQIGMYVASCMKERRKILRS